MNEIVRISHCFVNTQSHSDLSNFNLVKLGLNMHWWPHDCQKFWAHTEYHDNLSPLFTGSSKKMRGHYHLVVVTFHQSCFLKLRPQVQEFEAGFSRLEKEGELLLCFATIIISFWGASYGFQGKENGALPMASYYTKHLIEAAWEKGTEFSTCNMIGGSSKVRQLFCWAWVPKMDPCHVWRTKTIRSSMAAHEWNNSMVVDGEG